jgi:hypothetical protein
LYFSTPMTAIPCIFWNRFLLRPFINSFIMICESMLSVLLREMLLSKYRLQILDYIRFQILLVSKSICFFGGGQNYPPPLVKHWVGGLLLTAVTNLFSRAFEQLKSIGSRKCNPLENV